MFSPFILFSTFSEFAMTTTTTNIPAPSGFVPESIYDDTNRCLVNDLHFLLSESDCMGLYNAECLTDYELLEKVAEIVSKRVDPIGLIDHNTGLKK
jgi:hypothetical protein